jgi:hypothetical protein
MAGSRPALSGSVDGTDTIAAVVAIEAEVDVDSAKIDVGTDGIVSVVANDGSVTTEETVDCTVIGRVRVVPTGFVIGHTLIAQEQICLFSQSKQLLSTFSCKMLRIVMNNGSICIRANFGHTMFPWKPIANQAVGQRQSAGFVATPCDDKRK